MAILMVDGWDGERQIGKRLQEIEIRHVKRYQYAAKFCKDKKVLDCACGCGYGSAILSKVAKKVVGLDKKIAIEYAIKHWARPKIDFKIFNLNEESYLVLGKFDVIVSIETIEHLTPTISQTFMKFASVLNPGGYLITSHPTNEPDNPPVSKFHVHFKLRGEDVTEIMKKEGFTIIDDWFQDGRVSTIPHHILVGQYHG